MTEISSVPAYTPYYGRISTIDGKTSASQYDDAAKQGVNAKHVHIDEGMSGYHVAPEDRPEWRRVLESSRTAACSTCAGLTVKRYCASKEDAPEAEAAGALRGNYLACLHSTARAIVA